MKSIRILLTSTLVLCLANWSNDESNIEGRKKPAINFYGTLTTHADNKEHDAKEYQVENITISRLFRQIPVYEMMTENSIKAGTTNTYELASDPLDGIISHIDLSEVSALEIPNPDQIWSYQKNNKERLYKYVEIVVVSNDAKKTKNSYLIESNKKIMCDEKNDAGPIEMNVPLRRLKTLKIEGFEHRDSATQDCEKSPVKPCRKKRNKAKSDTAE